VCGRNLKQQYYDEKLVGASEQTSEICTVCLPEIDVVTGELLD